jgi:hypothetical protein
MSLFKQCLSEAVGISGLVEKACRTTNRSRNNDLSHSQQPQRYANQLSARLNGAFHVHTLNKH